MKTIVWDKQEWVPLAEHNRRMRDPERAKAFGHPLRVRVFEALEAGANYPSAIAERLNEAVPTIAYHIRILETCGMVELSETETARGGLRHVYRVKS